MQPAERNEIEAIRAELEGLRAQIDAVGLAGGRSWLRRATARPELAKTADAGRPGRVDAGVAGHRQREPPVHGRPHVAHVPRGDLTVIRRPLDDRLFDIEVLPERLNVTRGQMAAFLNRGLGRAAGTTGIGG